MTCQKCKKRIKPIPTMKLYTLEELEHAYLTREMHQYTKDEQLWFYKLYNRVFNQTKTPGCGKCFVNIRQKLEQQYLIELQNGEQ